jgi:hypothetical protein
MKALPNQQPNQLQMAMQTKKIQIQYGATTTALVSWKI